MSSPSLRVRAAACALAAATAACSGAVAGPRGAVAAFERFQDALFTGDRAALRALVTTDSRAVVAELPLGRLVGKERLEVVATRPRDPWSVLTVRDPNEGDRHRTYVMAREDGRWVVDLLETVAGEHETRPGPGTGTRLQLRPLDPAELDRIRGGRLRELR